jgi:hypothetical protein
MPELEHPQPLLPFPKRSADDRPEHPLVLEGAAFPLLQPQLFALYIC